MGLLFSTTIPMYLLSANFRGQAIYITILRRFREDLGYAVVNLLPSVMLNIFSGAFDVPKEKCPPDGGSLGCVTGSPMSIFPSSKKLIPTSLSHSSCDPLFKSTTQRSQSDYFISQRRHSQSISSPNASDSDISTPSLTPDSNNYRRSPDLTNSVAKPSSDALDFLMTVFPRHGLIALPYAKRMSISAPNLGVVFDGVVLDLPEEPRTLYVDGKSAELVNVRERWVHSSSSPFLRG